MCVYPKLFHLEVLISGNFSEQYTPTVTRKDLSLCHFVSPRTATSNSFSLTVHFGSDLGLNCRYSNQRIHLDYGPCKDRERRDTHKV